MSEDRLTNLVPLSSEYKDVTINCGEIIDKSSEGRPENKL